MLASVLLLAACEPPGRGDTVLFASGADLQSINPLFTVHPLARQTQRYVLLTTLVRYDSAYHVTPYLARRWQWSPDHRRVRLSLATSLRWHDGVPTTARDVVWTLDRARDPGTGYPRLPDLAGVSRVSAPDDSTVVIDFAVPRNDLPDVLTDLAILPAHLLDTVPAGGLRSAAWNQDPVGNGPFRFMAHEPNRRWVFEANPRFPAELGGPPGINRLVIAVVDEPTTKLAALASGELDFAGINPAHAGFVRRDPRLEVLSYPLLFTYGIVFNTREPPFNDRDLRAAISLALDRREIVEGYLYGFGTAASGPVVPGSPGAVDLPVTESLDSARRLLGGRTVRFELLTVGSGEAALEQMIQAQLKRVGIEVVIRQLELGAYLDRVNPRAHDFQAAVMGIPGDLDLGQIPRLAALTGFTVPADPVLAQRRFADSVPVAFIYHARGVQGKNRRVHGVRMDIRGEFPTVSGWTVAAEANAPRN
ncbi:MAG: ABC transporter substrate-binding protein [Gemmatimonadales bacterium]